MFLSLDLLSFCPLYDSNQKGIWFYLKRGIVSQKVFRLDDCLKGKYNTTLDKAIGERDKTIGTIP